MRGRVARLGLALMTAVLGIALLGCATGPTGGTMPEQSQASLLMEAGFRSYTPTNPLERNYIQTLPTNQVVLNQFNGKPIYLVCTGSDSNQCFLGDQAAYQRYQQLATKVCLSADQCQVQQKRWDPQAWQLYVDSQGAF